MKYLPLLFLFVFIFSCQTTGGQGFIAHYDPNGEGGLLSSPPETRENLAGREGCAIFYQGRLIAEIVTIMN